jgi:hypothetical protein
MGLLYLYIVERKMVDSKTQDYFTKFYWDDLTERGLLNKREADTIIDYESGHKETNVSGLNVVVQGTDLYLAPMNKVLKI